MLLFVRKLSVTTFIVLYTMLLMWSSVERTYSWAARQSESVSRPVSDDSARIGKPRPVSAPHQPNRRILEHSFVVEPPVFASWIVLTPQFLHQTSELLVHGRDASRLSGRAPPSSL
jgi:hypothetical protein